MIVTENNKVAGLVLNQYKVDYNSWPIDWLVELH
jgi:hypothetical protein